MALFRTKTSQNRAILSTRRNPSFNHWLFRTTQARKSSFFLDKLLSNPHSTLRTLPKRRKSLNPDYVGEKKISSCLVNCSTVVFLLSLRREIRWRKSTIISWFETQRINVRGALFHFPWFEKLKFPNNFPRRTTLTTNIVTGRRRRRP